VGRDGDVPVNVGVNDVQRRNGEVAERGSIVIEMTSDVESGKGKNLKRGSEARPAKRQTRAVSGHQRPVHRGLDHYVRRLFATYRNVFLHARHGPPGASVEILTRPGRVGLLDEVIDGIGPAKEELSSNPGGASGAQL
jgi:hypothetical protein